MILSAFRRSRRTAPILAVLSAICCAAHAEGPMPTPAGMWRTFDDDGKESGKVLIFQQNGVLDGRVAGIVDPAKADKNCIKCADDRKDKPVMGMVILTGMKQDGESWEGGKILDPETGSVYRCKMHVEDGGRKLVVRGYIGVSLFGRSQTWVRAAE